MSEEPTLKGGRITKGEGSMLRARHRLDILDVSKLSRFMAEPIDEAQPPNQTSPTEFYQNPSDTPKRNYDNWR